MIKNTQIKFIKYITLIIISLQIAQACHSSCICEADSNVCKSCKLDFIGSKVDQYKRSCSCPKGWYQSEPEVCEYLSADGQSSQQCVQGCKDYATLEEAKIACNLDPNCKGITWSNKQAGGLNSQDAVGNNSGYQLRASVTGSSLGAKENTWLKGQCPQSNITSNPCDFQFKSGTYLGECIQDCKDFATLADAQQACRNDINCGGVTFSRKEIGGSQSTNAFNGVWGYQLRKNKYFQNSPNGENSWLKFRCNGCGYNNADGKVTSGCVQDCKDFATLEQAMAACDADSSCKSITWSTAQYGGSQSTNASGNGHGYQLRGNTSISPSFVQENAWLKAECPRQQKVNDQCDFQLIQGTFFSECNQGCKDYSTLSDAQQACRLDKNCLGITFARPGLGGSNSSGAFDGLWGYQLKSGILQSNSPNGENSWVKVECPKNIFSCKKNINIDSNNDDISVDMGACKIDICAKAKDVKVLTNCEFINEGVKGFVQSTISLDFASINLKSDCLDSIKSNIQFKNPNSGLFIDLPAKYIISYPAGKKVIKIPLIDVYDLTNEISVNLDQISQTIHLMIQIGHEDSYCRTHKWDLFVYTNRDQSEAFQLDVDIQETSGCQPGEECIVVADVDTIGSVYTDNSFNIEKQQPLIYQVGENFYAKIKFADPSYTKKLSFNTLYYKADNNKIFNFSSITDSSWDGNGLRITMPLVLPTKNAAIQVNMKISPNSRFLQDSNNQQQTIQSKFEATVNNNNNIDSAANQEQDSSKSITLIYGIFLLSLLFAI